MGRVALQSRVGAVTVVLAVSLWAGRGEAQSAGDAAGAPCALSAHADKDMVGVGETFGVELRGSGPAGVVWTFPKEVSSDTVELRAAAPRAGTPEPGAFRYEAAAFAVGETEVPAIEARCRTTDGKEHRVLSSPVALRMASALPKDANEQKLADIRPPVSLTVGRAFWVALAAVVLGFLAGVAVLIWRLTRGALTISAAAPEVPADVEARAALARLGREGWTEGGERAFYIALAQIAKRYLERRLGSPILEMTSSEAVAFLREDARARSCGGVVRDLTAMADQVKFARSRGSDDAARLHLRATAQMVDALEDALRPAQEGAKGAAA